MSVIHLGHESLLTSFKRESGPTKRRLGDPDNESGSNRVVLHLKSQEDLGTVPMIQLKSSSLIKDQTILLVDTGSSVNIIMKQMLDPRVWINQKRVYALIGIGDDVLDTLGEVKLIIKGLETPFQVVSESFPILLDGILGIEALRQHRVVLNLIDDCLHLGDQDFPLLTHATIKLPARSKAIVKIILKRTNLREGYISRIDCGPGVYAGECLVSNDKGIARILMINSSNKTLNLTIPPTELESYETMQSFTEITKSIKDRQKEKAKRLLEIQKIVHLEDLSEEEKQSLLQVFFKFSFQFRLPGDKLGATNVVKHKIKTTNDEPIHTKQYRYPHIHKDEIRRQTDELLDLGIFKPSVSPYNSPLWIVPKKLDSKGNKKWRMVIDYRALNEKTIADAYPLPNITDILDQLGGAKYFSVMDLASVFHQIPMDPDSQEKTAFSTPYAHLEYTRMPFELKNAPATFQRVMDQVLSGLQGIELFVYMDDIVIYAQNLEDHTR